MKYKLIIILTFILFISCKKKKITLNLNDEKIIENCIKKIFDNEDMIEMKECYMVTPYLRSFPISYYPSKSIKTLFEKSNFDDDNFSKIQSSIDSKYKNVYFEELTKHSNCNESHTILTFSGAYNNLIFAQLIDTYEKVDKNKLKANYEIKPSQIFYYIFILNDEGEVEDYFQNAIFYD